MTVGERVFPAQIGRFRRDTLHIRHPVFPRRPKIVLKQLIGEMAWELRSQNWHHAGNPNANER
jgi:hypothetical protein